MRAKLRDETVGQVGGDNIIAVIDPVTDGVAHDDSRDRRARPTMRPCGATW